MQKLQAILCIVAYFFVQAVHVEGQNRDLFNDALSKMENAFNNINTDLTPEDAYYLGRAVAANILAAYNPYTQEPELTQYLNRICQTLVINSSQPVSFNGYHVIILDSSEFNAFATSGGHIFVTKKLADTAASEDMLAAVIAHELAHIILKHSVAIINDQRFINQMSEVADRALDFAGNTELAKRIAYFRESVSATVDTMLKSGYSQMQEFEADREAVTILLNSGYNPDALMEILNILQKEQNSQRGGFNTTHPSPAARIANLKTLNYRSQDTSEYREPRFKRFTREK